MVQSAMELLGGLALFLWGLEQMADALKLVAGERIKAILAKLTSNRITGVFTGALITAVIQSSSVTTVLVVGFISAGLMSMAQSIGVIMGANIGTTVTAQIIAFKVTKYALGLVAVGFAIVFVSKRETLRNHGRGILGLGLVFLGMNLMGSAMEPLRSYEPFLNWMGRLQTPLLGILAGALFTAIVQSSSATTGVVIVLASQGLITLPAGIALSFGANIGTCVTALLAAIGKPREALRASVVHVLFNVLGVLIWLAFIDELARAVTWLSPSAEGLAGKAKLAADTPRQIANAHTVFNVANALIFLGLITPLARFIEWLVPDRPLREEDAVRAKYLDEDLLDSPALALDRARRELLRMGDSVKQMMADIRPALLTGSREELEAIRERDDVVDALHGQIVTYLGRISRAELREHQTKELVDLLQAVNDLENIGDIIETDLVNSGLRRLSRRFSISPATRDVLSRFHSVINQSLDDALAAVTERDTDAASRVIAMKADVNRRADSASLHEAERLVAKEPNRLAAYTVEVEIIEALKRVYYFTQRIARNTAASTSTDDAT